MSKIPKLLFKITLKTSLLGFLLSLFLVIVFRFMPVPFSPLMVIRSLEYAFSDQNYPFRYDWVAYEDIAPNLSRAAIVSEDYNFFSHEGFDWSAIQKARHWNKTHKTIKGASTISQQTAKNLFLWPQRSWLRKGLEAYFTILIEFTWPKERILEVYLNVVEFGPGIYGAEAASQFYFKKSARKLNVAESARLVAVLPNPRRFKVNSPSPYILRRQQSIINRMWGFKISQN